MTHERNNRGIQFYNLHFLHMQGDIQETSRMNTKIIKTFLLISCFLGKYKFSGEEFPAQWFLFWWHDFLTCREERHVFQRIMSWWVTGEWGRGKKHPLKFLQVNNAQKWSENQICVLPSVSWKVTYVRLPDSSSMSKAFHGYINMFHGITSSMNQSSSV